VILAYESIIMRLKRVIYWPNFMEEEEEEEGHWTVRCTEHACNGIFLFPHYTLLEAVVFTLCFRNQRHFPVKVGVHFSVPF
jgi:hypothetical protein